MTFSEALTAIKDGAMVARSGWKGMRLFLAHFHAHPSVGEGVFHSIVMEHKGDVAVWKPDQADLLADDWWVAS